AGSSSRMTALVAEAARLARSNAPVERRQVAIRLLALADPKTARGSLPELLDARQPAAVQLAVLQALAGILDRATAQRVIGRWNTMSAAVRREAIEVLLSRRDGTAALLEALAARTLTASELDPSRLTQLRAHPDPALRARAQKVLAAEAVPSRDRSPIL